MSWRYLYILVLITTLQSGYSQQIDLRFKLIDQETEKPISGAHVFISNSSKGAISSFQGWCEMSISLQENQNFIISHVSYGTLVIDPKHYPLLMDDAILTMKSTGVDISQIQVSAKRGRKWKKKFKKFKQALFGLGTPASKCKILNPEVLRFEEHKGKLTVNAIDLLQIENNYLAYDMLFWLEELTIESDGSKYYKGKGQFTDKENATDNKFLKRREKSYLNSPAHFLRSILESSDKTELENNGYQVYIEKYEKKKFETISSPSPQDLIQADKTKGYFQLRFSDFLTIKHLDLLETYTFGTQVSISRAEQQNYGSNRTQSLGSKKQTAISRVYKSNPFLKFDIRGNIINKTDMSEFGYWADQGLATTLPVDYKNFSDFETIVPSSKSIDTLLVLKNLVGKNQDKKEKALKHIQDNWTLGYVAPLLDILRLSNDNWHHQKIEALLTEKIPSINSKYFEGIQWLWKNDPIQSNYYADFKAHVYKSIDTSFYKYFFERAQQSQIRLDEIVWGGVLQDGIPPLRKPKMLSASKAEYLSETNVVFGVLVNGEAYAYPKRILAWHEFFTDEISGLSIAGVYCTLCGTVIIYDTEFNGMKFNLGTSGFLYRSNKLMYDQATQSLWSTIEGKPVVGPLVEKNIQLETLPVETTTWGEWRKKHPNTLVLSLETGHDRNYAEGAAYKNYYADDALMFPVPKQDKRLANKARVFIPRPQNFKEYPLALSVDYLKQKGIHQDKIGEQNILILTENNGASRAYAIDRQQFKSYKKGVLTDSKGQTWEVTDTVLVGTNGSHLLRLPAHEIFWFAWVNVYPDTRIIY